MSHKLPELGYSYEALEPYIDGRTMEIHHQKHHGGYVSKLNGALQNYPDLLNLPLEKLLSDLNSIPENIRTAVRNNGGGHLNHSLFWRLMGPDGGGNAVGKLGEDINKTFGGFDKFKEEFSNAAATRFGSGWAWLVLDSEGRLKVLSTPNQDNPVSDGLKPVLSLDVWEHAYYLKYQNRRPDYIENWWNTLKWDVIEEKYRELKK